MNDTTNQSDQIMSAAGQSLSVQRTGGTHRPGDSIGAGSAAAKRKNWIKRAKYFASAIAVIIVSMTAAGLLLGGIGFTGVMMVALAVMAAAYVFSNYPKVKVPKRADLSQGDPKQMVARTELWLESQRPALPAPAAKIVEDLGVQLDSLGIQLETVDANHPAAREVRELVGEYIPETIDNYRKVPEHMRSEAHAGKTADQRLTDSLGKISTEVDRVTRRLAEGALDDLAIKDRYLEYRYGGDELLEDITGKKN
ncbi:hypothetical protein [Erythrobacter crassostreae]|uniref:5-bromo-4-chloroindolyl phosphate hydrolysis protein n=1 Tax=Erythrobacter crassostreae TaxID=2828328 RepID=A0A9X1F3G9_9SPHN|nr:hypothetical protein [Erythrobacter crassostrea]MBV7259024.1 hypothetical protein [Erythrobacter crassostrea]